MREGHALPYPGTPALTHPFDPCGSHGGFYLGSIGGPAARLAQDCIRGQEVLEYPELGMEAVWKIEVEDFPPFIVVDDKGNDFFTDLSGAVTVPISGVRVRSAQ
jgi:fumarate hydratase class I